MTSQAGKPSFFLVPGSRARDEGLGRIRITKFRPENQDGSKRNIKFGAGALHPIAWPLLRDICTDRWRGFLEVGRRSRKEGHRFVTVAQKQPAYNIPLSKSGRPGGCGSGEC